MCKSLITRELSGYHLRVYLRVQWLAHFLGAREMMQVVDFERKSAPAAKNQKVRKPLYIYYF